MNPIFCVEIFLVQLRHVVPLGASRWPLQYSLSVTLEQNALALQNLAQMCSFNSLKFHKHVASEF